MIQKTKIISFVFVFLLSLFVSSTYAVSVQLKIVDQFGNNLPSAKITVPGKGIFSAPANVELAPGDYTFTLQPDSNASLTRDETPMVTSAVYADRKENCRYRV